MAEVYWGMHEVYGVYELIDVPVIGQLVRKYASVEQLPVTELSRWGLDTDRGWQWFLWTSRRSGLALSKEEAMETAWLELIHDGIVG